MTVKKEREYKQSTAELRGLMERSIRTQETYAEAANRTTNTLERLVMMEERTQQVGWQNMQTAMNLLSPPAPCGRRVVFDDDNIPPYRTKNIASPPAAAIHDDVDDNDDMDTAPVYVEGENDLPAEETNYFEPGLGVVVMNGKYKDEFGEVADSLDNTRVKIPVNLHNYPGKPKLFFPSQLDVAED